MPYRNQRVADGVIVRVNADDASDVMVRLDLSAQEVLALDSGAGSVRVSAAAEALRRHHLMDANVEAWLSLPAGSNESARIAMWLHSLSPAQRRVVEALRERKRRDSQRGDEYRIVGVDAAGRPVMQKPQRLSGGVDRWAVLRSGAPTDVSDPVQPIREVLARVAA